MALKNVEQFCDASVAIIVNAMRQFCRAHWRPDRFYLMNKKPQNIERFAKFFGAPIEYQAPASKLSFSTAVLDAPVQVHDHAYREILTPILEKAIESTRRDFAFAVKSILNSRVGDGRLTRPEVSRALGVSVHILSRRLKSAGARSPISPSN